MQCAEIECPDASLDFVDLFSEPVFVCKQGTVVRYNQAALSLFGGSLCLGGSVADLLGMAVGDPACAGLSSLVSRGPINVDVHGEEGKLSAELQVYPLPAGFSDEDVPFLLISLRVSSRFRVDEASSCRPSRLAAILDAVVDGILVVDPKGIVVSANRAALLLFNRHSDEMQGLGICAMIPQFAAGRWASCVNASWLVGRSQEMSGRHRDGTLFPLEVTVTHLDEGEGPMFAVVLRDITDRCRSEQAELRYMEALERQIEMRTGELHKLHRRTEGILNSASDAIMGIDINGRITFANPVAGALLGYPPLSLPGKLADDVFIHGDGVRSGRSVLVRAALRRRLFHERMELTLCRRDGSSFVAEYSSRPLEDDTGMIGAVVVLRDITGRKVAEERLGVAAKVLETTAEAIFVCDLQGRILVANPAAVSLSGVSDHIPVGLSVTDIVFGGDSRGWPSLLDGMQAQEGHCRREMWSVRCSGERFALRLTASALRLTDGQLHRVVLVANDITQRKQDEEKVQYQANYDVLTALPNRNLFNDRLEHMLRVISRTEGSIALMFLDLDGFKCVNDDFGHEVGDILLQEVARRLVSCVRDSDTVARFGGDEFTIILGVVDGCEGAAHVARRILQVLAAPYSLLCGQQSIRIQDISASIGIVILSGCVSEDSCHLLRKADAAMYHAKQSGKNGFAFWDEVTGETTCAHTVGCRGA
ncbi:PAS domain S-box protein [Haematospirillum sp. 15-248]|uniref:sensor domain-containing protein n=1 Tax=Haematospirillum sp. 15-248 TaxID=2723107 RepID=UPI00143A71C1|nr:PAS domain S-box protein [Haematospirillum sp. 15-248]NKD86832.1 PAS domain S-box protein [Haematospirillum sp. 15-248]